MPSLVSFFVKHILIGFAIAAIFVAMLLYLDINGLQTMIIKDEMWYLALFLLWFGNATVFGALQVAYAVMTMAEDD